MATDRQTYHSNVILMGILSLIIVKLVKQIFDVVNSWRVFLLKIPSIHREMQNNVSPILRVPVVFNTLITFLHQHIQAFKKTMADKLLGYLLSQTSFKMAWKSTRFRYKWLHCENSRKKMGKKCVWYVDCMMTQDWHAGLRLQCTS